IGPLANDHDDDGDRLFPHVVTGPTNASVTMRDDGSFVYRPNIGYVGVDSFTYQVSDGFLDSNVATVKLKVIDPPRIRFARVCEDHFYIDLDTCGASRSNVYRINMGYLRDQYGPGGPLFGSDDFTLEQRDAAGNWVLSPVQLVVENVSYRDPQELD